MDWSKKIEGKIKKGEPLSLHTSIGIGGKADYFIIPASFGDLKRLMGLLKKSGNSYFVVGNGTNLLFSDKRFKDMIIHPEFKGYTVRGRNVVVRSGENLTNFAVLLARRGLAGLEFAAGIPGSMGGAVMTNAGAFGHSLCEVVTSVKGLDETGRDIVFPSTEIKFGYRKTELPCKIIFTEVELKLHKGSPEKILSRMEKFIKKRKATQPYNVKTAGCIFKNPKDGLPTGRLIEKAGLKGLKLGGAMVSNVHANFIENRKRATASDVLGLVEWIRDEIFDRYKINLELEIEVVK